MRQRLDLPRIERAAEAATLYAQGLTVTQVAHAMGISRSWAHALIHDPDGALDTERKKRYGGVCEKCGAVTYGGNGRAKASKRCKACANEAVVIHGRRHQYNLGCRCDACTVAMREYMRTLKGKTPPSHGASGYQNYGCRCAVCTRANTEVSWGYGRRHALKKRREAA